MVKAQAEAVLLQFCAGLGPEHPQLSEHARTGEQFRSQGDHKTQHRQAAIPALGLIRESPVVQHLHGSWAKAPQPSQLEMPRRSQSMITPQLLRLRCAR